MIEPLWQIHLNASGLRAPQGERAHARYAREFARFPKKQEMFTFDAG